MDKKKILVVDDEELIGELCTSILEDEGYDTVYCSNITDAISTIDSQKIDLIISDIKMPGGDGIEFKTILNSKNCQIPFLFMTGFSTIPEDEVSKLNAIGVVKKPFSIESLTDILKQHI